MNIDAIAIKIAKRELDKLDWTILKDVLRDEIRWGIRGEMNEPGSEELVAVFDTPGDAEKFRRLAIRYGYEAKPVEEVNVTEYEGMDYVVRILYLN